MKIIKLYGNQHSLIKKAIENNSTAQKLLFEQYAPKMLGVCRQYVKDLHHAEDLLLQGFLKVFTKLHTFKNEGSFEGWIRRIMVNTCISNLRKKNSIEQERLLQLLVQDKTNGKIANQPQTSIDEEIKQQLKTPAIFDGRNQYNIFQLNNKGFEYYQIGKS